MGRKLIKLDVPPMDEDEYRNCGTIIVVLEDYKGKIFEARAIRLEEAEITFSKPVLALLKGYTIVDLDEYGFQSYNKTTI
jgi:hypothetical protein